MAWISSNKKKLLQIQKKYINEDFQYKKRKLRYFGLPSGSLIDLEIWNEFLGGQIICMEYDMKEYDKMLGSIQNAMMEDTKSGKLKLFGTIDQKELYVFFYDVNDFITKLLTNKDFFSQKYDFYPNLPFDVVSLGYTGLFSKKYRDAFIHLLDLHSSESKRKRDKKIKDFIVLYSVKTQRGSKTALEEVDSLVNDARGWSVRSNNNAIEIFEWLEKDGFVRDKLIVALPYFILRESLRNSFNADPLFIILWKTGPSYFINACFRLSHRNNSISRPPNETLRRVPIKDVKLIENGEVFKYESAMPEFKIF